MQVKARPHPAHKHLSQLPTVRTNAEIGFEAWQLAWRFNAGLCTASASVRTVFLSSLKIRCSNCSEDPSTQNLTLDSRKGGGMPECMTHPGLFLGPAGWARRRIARPLSAAMTVPQRRSRHRRNPKAPGYFQVPVISAKARFLVSFAWLGARSRPCLTEMLGKWRKHGSTCAQKKSSSSPIVRTGAAESPEETAACAPLISAVETSCVERCTTDRYLQAKLVSNPPNQTKIRFDS